MSALVRLLLVALLLSGCTTASSQSILDFFEALTVAAGRASLEEESCAYQSERISPGSCDSIRNTCRDDGLFQPGDGLAFDDPPEWLTIQGSGTARQVCVASDAPLVSGNFSYTYVRFRPQSGVLGLSTAPALFVGQATATPQSLRTGESTRLGVVIEFPGAPPYQFAWVSSSPGLVTFDDPGRQDPVATVVVRPPRGTVTFTVTVTDAAGQTGQATVTVDVTDEALRVTATATPSTINRGESSQLVAVVENGTPPFSYSWSPASTVSDFFADNPIATPTVTTTYQVAVSDNDFQRGTATVTVTVIQPPPSAQADLALTITESADPVTRNTLFTYTFTVTNNGPAAATNVVLRVLRVTTLEAGFPILSQGTCTLTASNFTCPIGTMASGAVVTGTQQAFASAPPGTINISGSVQADQDDPNFDNNLAAQTTTIVAPSAPN